MTVDPSRLGEAREVYLRAMADVDATVAAQGRQLMLDLDPGYVGPGDKIRISDREFDLDDIEDAYFSFPMYGSGHIEIRTRDGQEHVFFTDLRDPYDNQAYVVLNERFPGSA